MDSNTAMEAMDRTYDNSSEAWLILVIPCACFVGGTVVTIVYILWSHYRCQTSKSELVDAEMCERVHEGISISGTHCSMTANCSSPRPVFVYEDCSDVPMSRILDNYYQTQNNSVFILPIYPPSSPPPIYQDDIYLPSYESVLEKNYQQTTPINAQRS